MGVEEACMLCLVLNNAHQYHCFLFLQAKVNNQGQVGMAYTQNLRPDVKLNLSALVEGKNVNAGGHKLGASITFDSSENK